MKHLEIANILEDWAPLSLQESYDNCGFQVGNAQAITTNVLLTLDVTPEVVHEAIRRHCNLIIAHHPIIFRPLHNLATPSSEQEVIRLAIKNDITIYAIHTNLDNIATGVNAQFAAALDLRGVEPLQPLPQAQGGDVVKIRVFCPRDAQADEQSWADRIATAAFDAGAGRFGNYEQCSFRSDGTGSFMPKAGSNPFIGKLEVLETPRECCLELVTPAHRLNQTLTAIRNQHPYEEPAIDIVPMPISSDTVGSGAIGHLQAPMDQEVFLRNLKQALGTQTLRHSALLPHVQALSRVAICGGAGSFLIEKAIREGAQAFVTSDLKYHEFFRADNCILLVDVGHFESEQFTPHLISAYLRKKLPNFAPLISTTSTNPVHYF